MAGEDAGAQRGALGAHFRSRIPALLEAWRAAIAADPDLTTGDSLPRGQLVDHLPPWLEVLAAALAAAPGSAEARHRRSDETAGCPGARPAALAAGLRPARGHARVGGAASVPGGRARPLLRRPSGGAGGAGGGSPDAGLVRQRGGERERGAVLPPRAARGGRRGARPRSGAGRHPGAGTQPGRALAAGRARPARQPRRGRPTSPRASPWATCRSSAARPFSACCRTTSTRCTACSTTSPTWRACTPARRCDGSRRSTPPTCCADSATTSGRWPRRRSST